MEKLDVKFQLDNFSGTRAKGGSSELWTRITIFLWGCAEGRAAMSKLYGNKSWQKRTRTGSVQSRVCPVSGVSKKRRSVVGPRQGSEETDVRTDGLKNTHVPPLCSPRSRYRPAKYCYRSARRWITDARAQRPAERKEGPITIDRPAKVSRLEALTRREDRQDETKKEGPSAATDVAACAKDALWDYDVNSRFKVCYA